MDLSTNTHALTIEFEVIQCVLPLQKNDQHYTKTVNYRIALPFRTILPIDGYDN